MGILGSFSEAFLIFTSISELYCIDRNLEIYCDYKFGHFVQPICVRCEYMQAISFVSGIIQACCQFERTNACCKHEWICRENKYLQVSKLLNVMLKKNVLMLYG